ncbi:MAG: cadherin-like beta sandwich domain-containing protein, partial [Lachnospiraceae bacterium]|nr:cadherin-like beta sandwich domain-containing protein [Lachnospiraceae bacterium]
MKLLKKKAKRFLSLMLAVLLTWTLIPASALTVWADGESGSFVLMALSGGQPIIPPTTIHYNPGSSVKDALLASGYTFAGLEDGGWINAVEGVSDSYILYYDNAGYDLTVSADQISAIWITGNYEQAYSDALLSLEKDLAAYREAGDGRTQYAPLAEAANAALSGYWSADADTAAAMDAELLSKTEDYLELIHGDTAPVILQITRGGTPVASATCTFTNAYGTESVMDLPQDGRVSLVPGAYSFDISDGLFSHIKGNLTVEAGTENVLSVELPSGQWIADVDLGLATDWSEPVTKTGTFGSDAVYYLPDYAGTKLFIYAANAADVDPASVRLYFGTDSEMQSGAKVWNSHTTYVNNAVEANSLTPGYARVEARKAMADGTTQTQEYRISFVRVPTLSGLTVKAKGTKLPLEFNPDTLEYTLSTVENQVDLTATLLCDNAALTVNGSAVENGSPTTVTLQNKGVTTVKVTAAADGVERSYVLKIEKKESAEVTLNHAAGMTTCIKNAAGEEILPATESAAADTYHLTPGETYTWIGTKDTWYHTSGSFTASAGLKVNAATPVTTDWITSMDIKSATGTAAVMYPIVPDFAPSEHELDFQIGTSRTFCYMTANVAASDLTIHLSYNSYKGDPIERDHTVGKATNIPTLINQNGNTNRLAITVTKTDSTGVTYYQDYKVRVRRLMEANSIKVSDPDGNELVLTQDTVAAKTGYDKTVLNYTAGVAKKTQTLNIDTQLYSSLVGNDFNGVITVASPEGSSEIRFDEEHAPNVAQTTSIALDPKKAAEDITITIGHTDPEAIEQVYTVHVTKLDPVVTRFNITPADATLFLTEDLSGVRILPEEDGSYALCETLTYNYVITAKGYVGTSGSFTSDKNVTSYNYNLVKAEETSYKDISGDDDWSSFRQGTENNGITDSKTPIKAEDAVLVWANKIGDGYGSGATGCPILVGGYLYTYAGTSIVKVDKETGEVVQSGDMVASSSFAINSPTYANGLIFVGLSNGRIQAFNAETLESVWLYTDPLGGQPNSTIAYKDGYIYTGFWNSETKKANFVCISVTDEDPAQTTEAKLATWRHTDKGFYWAGAYVTDAYTLVTTDDGDSGSSTGHGSVISFDPVTGAILDKFEAPVVGDLRSSICYDAATDACYFTSKGGYFCSIRMNADGTFREDSFRSIKLSNGSENSVAMSSSTPTVYKGRAYVGASGTGQFTQYSGHNITVIDLASWSIAYTVPTQGYPQTSGLLTTAYENDTEYVYVYFLDNFTPGKLRVLRDKAGQTALDPAYSTHESYTEKNVTYDFDTAYVLFTPSGKQAQYAICSPIVDADGNIYFKNDSAQLMKLSSMITSLEVTQDPSTAVYCKGQTFDPAGMKVTARYSNGTTKDISAYVSCYLDSEWTED